MLTVYFETSKSKCYLNYSKLDVEGAIFAKSECSITVAPNSTKLSALYPNTLTDELLMITNEQLSGYCAVKISGDWKRYRIKNITYDKT